MIGTLDIAIAGFVLKWKNAMRIGIAMLPPPVPAIFASDIKRLNTISPHPSVVVIGKIPLCLQKPIVCPFFIWQTWKGLSVQS